MQFYLAIGMRRHRAAGLRGSTIYSSTRASASR